MRIYTSDNRPLDFCWDCAPDEALAEEEYGDMGDGPDGRGNCFAYDAEHPPYDDGNYRCHECGKRLAPYTKTITVYNKFTGQELDTVQVTIDTWMDKVDQDGKGTERVVSWAGWNGYAYDDLHWDWDDEGDM